MGSKNKARGNCCHNIKAGAGRDFPSLTTKKSVLRWELCLHTIPWDSCLSQRLFSGVFTSDSSAPGQSSARQGRMSWLPGQLGSQPAPQHALVAQQSDFPLTRCP